MKANERLVEYAEQKQEKLKVLEARGRPSFRPSLHVDSKIQGISEIAQLRDRSPSFLANSLSKGDSIKNSN